MATDELSTETMHIKLVGLFIFIPVFTIPGNDLKFQLSIYTRENYILMSFFAILVGVTFAMQIYAGSIFFVLKNQSYFLFGAIALMLISLYFSVRKINNICDSC